MPVTVDAEGFIERAHTSPFLPSLAEPLALPSIPGSAIISYVCDSIPQTRDFLTRYACISVRVFPKVFLLPLL